MIVTVTPQELISQLLELYGIDIDLSYAINYIDTVGEYAEVNGFYLWLQEYGYVE